MGCRDRESNFQCTFYDANGEQWWSKWGDEITWEARIFDRDVLAKKLESMILAPGRRWKVTVSNGWYVARVVKT